MSQLIHVQHQSEIASLRVTLENLTEQLDFTKGVIPAVDRCFDNQETTNGHCSTHGDYTQVRIWMEFRGRVSDKRSRCPDCIATDIQKCNSALNDLIVASLLEDARIAPRFEHCCFDNFEAVTEGAKRNLSLMKSYAEAWPEVSEKGSSLILMGRCGTGKNHLAVSLARQLIERHHATVCITSVMRIIRAIKRSWGRNADITEDEVIDYYVNRDLLIVDEVGIQFGSETEKILLFDIVNTRYELMKPTVLISNLTLSEVAQAIGERLVDRMAEGEGATLVFDWESYRNRSGVTNV